MFQDHRARSGRPPRTNAVAAEAPRLLRSDDRNGNTAGVRERRAERKRQEILQAGLKVFAAKGFTAATMDDIALELEATKGLLYYHFKTKDDLLREILERNDLTAGLDHLLEDLDSLSLRDALFELSSRVITLFEANRELTRFLHVHSLLSGTEASIIYREVFARIYLIVAQLLEGFRERGQVRCDVEPMGAAHVLSSVILSDIAQRFVFGAEHDTGAGYLAQAIDILLLGMEPDRRS
ncbi:MAG TPA: TetR/AcrR family transcriptional regulator [Candidatus Limnocylindrales bacterium]|nr:TetR/AcrR family transcriptional regulator [Candidatus Limnocylindrales bacterium]